MSPAPGPDRFAGTVTTPAGRKLDVRYEVVPAADLEQATGDLQPRDRAGRLASDAQIQNIAANLDPSRLMRSTESDRGAPIIGSDDNIIESGNGRVQAIMRAAQQNPEGYARYVQALRDAGYNVNNVDTPVLVARRVTELTPEERIASVREHNQGATQRMSGPEQAKVDGKNLTADLLNKYDHTQEPTASANRGFVTDWVNTLPEAERNAVMDADGHLSSEGVRRLNGAMLARAYDDPGVLARGLEATDDTTRSISGALTDAAPGWAKLRADIEAGRVPADFDASRQLIEAVDLARQARAKKQSLSDILNQGDAFNPIDPVTEQFVRALYSSDGKRVASRPAIADTLGRYAEEARRQSTTPDLFGGAEKVSPRDAIEAINKSRAKPGAGGDGQGNLLGGDAGKMAADDRPHEAAPTPASPGQGTTRSPLGGVRPVRDFNEGTSPYRQVFRDAGLDPDLTVNRPLREQNKIIADQMKAKFGFKDVVVDPKQNPKEVRDQLSNFYQNAHEMAAALGMPFKAIGLDGAVTFTTKPYRQKNQALGSYAPGTRTINIPGRSNSFAHEWTHALDHHLAIVLPNNPKAMRLLSQRKSMQDNPITAPGSVPEAFVGVLKALFGKDAAKAAEALKAQFDARHSDPKIALPAQRRLDQIQTDLAAAARKADAGQKTPYWATPHEMLARAHESYVSDLIQRQGGDPRAIAKPYYDAAKPGDSFARLYPQAAERDHIFAAFTELHDRLRAQTILGTDPAATRPGGLDIVDPSAWNQVANRSANPSLWDRLKTQVQQEKNVRKNFLDNMGVDPTAADPGHLTLKVRATDNFSALFQSIRSLGNKYTARQPKGPARDAFQTLMDRMAPAEGLRKPTPGREIGPVFEEEVRHYSNQNIDRMTNILASNGLERMSLTEGLMLRHVLTEGRDNFIPSKSNSGAPIPIPANIKKAAGQLRFVLDEELERNRAAGIDVGPAESGFYPRLYNDTKVFGDGAGFQRAADKLHRLMFEREVGDNPEKLLAEHDDLAKHVRAGLDPDTIDKVKALRKNLKDQDKLDPNNPNDAAKLAQLRQDAADLHDALHDPIRDAYAKQAAEDWYQRINLGDPTDYDTKGPNASYTRARVLPPEADTIMRDYLETDPLKVLPGYFQKSARKVAYNKRFGKGVGGDYAGDQAEALLRTASEHGSRGEDIRAMRRLIQTVTGRQRSGLPPEFESVSDFAHMAGILALMPHAAWASLAEPIAMMARTGRLRDPMRVIAGQIKDIVDHGGRDAKQALSDAIGFTQSIHHETMMNDRSGAQYANSPRIAKIMAGFYRATYLSQLTNSQKRNVMVQGHNVLHAWSGDFLGKNARLARDAAAEFRDLGIPDAQHQNFAKWLTQHPGLPTIQDATQTQGGRLWSQAVSRLGNQVIQEPMKVDKPLHSANPVGRMSYGLMGFLYSWYHNIAEATVQRHGARIGEAFEDARKAGAGRAGATLAAAPAAARAGSNIALTAAAVFAGTYLVSTLRERLLNSESWDQHEKDGTLHDHLVDLAIQRTGINGPLDPVMQAFSGLKYQRDLVGVTAGPQLGYFLQAAGDMARPFVPGTGADTNTTRYNAAKGFYNMFGVPGAALALSMVGRSPLVQIPARIALQKMTSHAASDAFATTVAGPKGSGPGGEPPPEPKPPDPDKPIDQGGRAFGGIPVGMLDDVAAPAARVGLPLWARLPRVGKIGVAGAAGLAGFEALKHDLDRYKEGGGN